MCLNNFINGTNRQRDKILGNKKHKKGANTCNLEKHENQHVSLIQISTAITKKSFSVDFFFLIFSN